MEDQPTVIQACCKNCGAWKPVEEKGPKTIGALQRGICHGLPPIPYPRFDKFGNMAGQMDMRPCPTEDNVCLLFSPRADLIPGTVTPP